MNHQQKSEHDELRASFTKWLEKCIRNAANKYLARQEKRLKTVSLEEIPEDMLPVSTTDDVLCGEISQTAFHFEEERLAEAFANLPLKRQQILTMLFVEGRKPEEIARLLNCSAQHVYDQRYQALKKLRIALSKEGDEA